MRMALIPLMLMAGAASADTAGSGTAGSGMARDHDELPRVAACQERLAAAAEAFRRAMPGYDLAYTLRAAERPEIAGGPTIVTCSLREADDVPALAPFGEKS